jgi:FAD/FMN-containing dehydrogenase
MGLTGLVTWAEVQLRPIVSRRIRQDSIKFQGLGEFFALSRETQAMEYTVAWLDCVSTGKNFARGIFMRGDHSGEAEPLRPSPRPRLSMPVDLPAFLMNRATIGAFNSAYYGRQRARSKSGLVDYEPFFYPLDFLLHWNRAYGRDGLLQFQNVMPWEPGEFQEGFTRLLKAITASGLGSFLAVIKIFGEVKSPGMMSFPAPGPMIALDFPIRGERSFDLVDRLADITAEFGGRMYAAKDARMRPRHFQQFYPQWQEFARHIDPAFSSAFWQRVTRVG